MKISRLRRPGRTSEKRRVTPGLDSYRKSGRIRGAEPIPAKSRSKRVTLVKTTLFHSKVPKAIICFFSIYYSRIHVF